jgi:hypothetical protein
MQALKLSPWRDEVRALLNRCNSFDACLPKERANEARLTITRAQALELIPVPARANEHDREMYAIALRRAREIAAQAQSGFRLNELQRLAAEPRVFVPFKSRRHWGAGVTTGSTPRNARVAAAETTLARVLNPAGIWKRGMAAVATQLPSCPA